MRSLVTGVTGFAGGHLAEALLARGDRVFGVARQGAAPAGVKSWDCDLCAGAEVEAILREAQPERIYHLAGYAHVGRSFQEPGEAWRGNLTATLSLYDAVARWGGRPRILFVGSGMVYGDGEPGGRALDEDAPLRPTSPYATSKAAADLAGYQYGRSPGLDVVRARPFNHIGPRQQPQFAVAHFARQLVAVERGRQPPVLQTGDLSPCRDLSDVRDVAAAYVLLLERGRGGEAYNVGSGQAHSMQSVLDRLVALTGLNVEVRRREELVRPTEPAAVRADASKLRRETGWAPRFTLDQTLADTLAYWRQQA